MGSWHPYYLSPYLSFQSVSHSICVVIHVNLVVTEGEKTNPEIFFFFFFWFLHNILKSFFLCVCVFHRESNRRFHSKPGAVPFVADRTKQVVDVKE